MQYLSCIYEQPFSQKKEQLETFRSNPSHSFSRQFLSESKSQLGAL